jgi:hypothetical protein
MKLAVYFTISAFLLGMSAAAQSKPSTPDSAVTVRPNYSPSQEFSLSGAACPIRMRALQGTGHGLVAVRDDHKAPVPECPLDRVGTSDKCPSSSQRIHLILANSPSKTYASATVFVRGLTPKGRIERADSGAAGPSEISKTLTVTFAPEDEKSMSADLVLPGFSSVTFVQLKSITYQDGSSWKMNGELGQMCRVAPDPLMLIAVQ